MSVMTMVKTLPLMEAFKSLNLPGLERNLFSSPDWLTVLDKTYNCKLFVKYIERNGRIVSHIIYCAVKNFLEWKICICSYCDYFDCTIERKEDWQAFFESLRQEYPQYRIAVRNLRDETARAFPEFKVLSKERFHLLDVREPIEKVWKRTHDSFKSAVKQSQKVGVRVQKCGRPGLEDFFRLHLNLRKNKYRLFPQPFRFFDHIWQQYMEKGQGILLGAFDPQGHFIGGNIYLICGDTLYYKFNTSALGSLKYRPNNLLFWEGIKLAKERDLKFIDMGSSGYNQEGLILFKNHTGAQCLDITHLGFTPPGYKFSQKRILKFMTRAFTMPWMPDSMLEWGSSLIYPYLA